MTRAALSFARCIGHFGRAVLSFLNPSVAARAGDQMYDAVPKNPRCCCSALKKRCFRLTLAVTVSFPAALPSRRAPEHAAVFSPEQTLKFDNLCHNFYQHEDLDNSGAVLTATKDTLGNIIGMALSTTSNNGAPVPLTVPASIADTVSSLVPANVADTAASRC